MSKLVRTEKGFNGYNVCDSMILTDIKDNRSIAYKSDIKQMIKNGEISPIDFGLNKYDELVEKNVQYTQLCREYNEQSPLTEEEQAMLLFYGAAKLTQLSDEERRKLGYEYIKTNTIHTHELHDAFERATSFVKYYWNSDDVTRDKMIKIVYLLAEV